MRTKHQPGSAFAPCGSLSSPTIRYDGVVAACCNERAIMGWGPKALRRQAHRPRVAGRRGGRASKPTRSCARSAPSGRASLTAHPRFADLADTQFTSVCDVCWKMLDRTADDAAPDPLIGAISTMLVPSGRPRRRGAVMSASQRLRFKLDLAYPALAAAASRLWGDERVRELYPLYLEIWHGVVRSAVPLIEAAARSRARARARRRGRRAARAVLRASRPRGGQATTSGCSRISRRSAAIARLR